jgi:hypothetical protein
VVEVVAVAEVASADIMVAMHFAAALRSRAGRDAITREDL